MKTKKNIAIQGRKGSFHHIVAEKYFGKDLSLILCDTFDKTVSHLIQGKADYVVMATKIQLRVPSYQIMH